ncbi:Peptidyl-prolyl cis-trans isomerase [hydrothermal vent metagenome]|uniref:peptidylprolyl isomerase n=1 Tax=hydrothermal vent metagenome TaxID=652676 RepID=A0A3B0SPZ2_9ZZZZ
MKLLIKMTMILGFLTMSSLNSVGQEPDLENTLYLDLKDGRVTIEMYPDVAPKTVKRIKQLVRSGFYDGLTFHRVIPGFMAQGGDPKGNGSGGSGQNIPAEFSDLRHLRGMLSMARVDHPDSADSQFFIVLDVSPHLDGSYTIWGRVIGGMKYVDHIKPGVVPELQDPDKIIKMQVAADVE